MPVTGSFYSGRQPHSASYGVAERPQPGSAPVDRAAATERSAHFSMISTISHSSLAAAYQALHSAPVAGPQAQPAILSGAGVPAALAAYGEMSEVD